MLFVIRENYQFYFLFLPVFFISAIVLPASSLIVLAGALTLFLYKERTDLIVATFIVIIVMGDNLWDMFAIFKISRIVILLFTLIISWRIMVYKERGVDTRIIYFLPFWVVALISSLLYSNSYLDSITRVFSYLFLVISVFTFFRYAYRNKRELVKEQIFVVTALILLISWAGIFSPLRSLFYFSNRFMGIFGNPNTMSLFIIMMYPMIGNINFDHTRISNVGKNLLLGLLIISVLLTGSRNGTISLMIYILGKIFLQKGISGKTISISISCIALLALLNFRAISTSIPMLKNYARVETLENSTASGRTLVWAVAVNQIKSKPWLGGGLNFTGTYFGDFKEQHELVGRYWNSVWNSYLAILLETGGLGLVGYIFFLSGLLRKTMRNPLVYPFLVAALFSAIFESWMISSLNVCTALFLFNFIILSDRD